MSLTDAIARQVMKRLDVLAEISEQAGALTRRYLTPEHAAANEVVGAWMMTAGMDVRIDAIGNVVGRYEGEVPGGPALIFGSHLDTVIDAGRYDGMLGVVLPIACIRAFHESGRRFPFAVEVIGFGDEEGVRFQSTYLGSRAVAGAFDRSLLERRDAAGVSLAEAMVGFGLDPDEVGDAARDPADVLGYVEVHIEQGPVLERARRPLGVVTAIAGATRLEVTLTGTAGHAGTVPMAARADALAAAAEAVLFVEAECGGVPDVVGTVGRLDVVPGAVNVIPGGTQMSIDLRAADDGARHAVLAAIRAKIQEITARRGVTAKIIETHAAASVPCAPALSGALAAAARAAGFDAPALASGAGHDAAAMSGLTDVAMLFVRCTGGISHNPAEAVETEDVAAAVAAVMAFLEAFDPFRQGNPV